MGLCLGLASHALATYALDENTSEADHDIVEIEQLVKDHTGSTTDALICPDAPCYFVFPLLTRMLLDPTIRGRMNSESLCALERIHWLFLREYSNVFELDHPETAVWNIYASENHDVLVKSTLFLAAQALHNYDYYRDAVIDHGGSVEFHWLKWSMYFEHYFSERAKEGISCELNSNYAKYTIAAYYNIADFGQPESLRKMARNFIHLWWADIANEYVKSGIRGGAQTRAFPDDVVYGSDNLNNFYRLYGWRSELPSSSVQPVSVLIAAVSGYSMPDVITAIATNTTEPYQYISRRFGLDTPDGKLPSFDQKCVGFYSPKQECVQVQFDIDGEERHSNLRRYTYRAPEYVMGSMTFAPGKEYIEVIDQNRAMGIFMANHQDSRIVVMGNPNMNMDFPKYHFADITGTAWGSGGQACMVVGRDPRAQISDETWVFISHDIWLTRIYDGKWIFLSAGDAYTALFIPCEQYETSAVPLEFPSVKLVSEQKAKEDRIMLRGIVLRLQGDNAWTPVLIQMGQAMNYKSYSDFQQSILANPVSYNDDVLIYTAEDKSDFYFWNRKKSYRAPEILLGYLKIGPPDQWPAPWVHSLNPAKSYSIPYILGLHGQELITISFPGFDKLELQFNVYPDGSWQGTNAMVALDGYLYIIQNSRLHRVNPSDGSWQLLGGLSWPDTEGMTALEGYLYIVQNNRLHKVNPSDGSWSLMTTAMWQGTEAMGAFSGNIYIVKNGGLFHINLNDGLLTVLARPRLS